METIYSCTIIVIVVISSIVTYLQVRFAFMEWRLGYMDVIHGYRLFRGVGDLVISMVTQ